MNPFGYTPKRRGFRGRGGLAGRGCRRRRRGLLLALPAVVLQPGDHRRVRLPGERRRVQHHVGRPDRLAVGVHGAGAVGVGVAVQAPVCRDGRIVS